MRPMRSFDRLLDGARVGDDEAWTELYRSTAPAVLGYLRSRGAAEPEDLLGEVYLGVARGLHRFRGDEGGFRSWLFTIAHRRLVDERRSRACRPVEPVADPETEPAPGPESAALRHVWCDELVRTLSRLPVDQGDVLTLRLVGGLTVDEIALLVGRSRGAVKALQRRGLRNLERSFAEAVPI